MPVVELSQTGVVTATNTFGAAGLVSRRDSVLVPAVSIFYTFDAQGSVTQRVDTTGIVLSNHLFSAHGSNMSGTSNDAFGYKAQFGYHTDNETGLQVLTLRYFDPSTGRFLTRDPIDYDGGINLYGYVANNPVNAIDPVGLQRWPRVRYRKSTPAPDCDPCNDPSNWNTRVSDAREIASSMGWSVNDKGKWSDNSHLPFNDVIRRLSASGFQRFMNINPEHYGGWDYEGQINGRWYHITIMRPPQSWIDLLISGRAHKTKPPPNIYIHCERYYYQPSSIAHAWDQFFGP